MGKKISATLVLILVIAAIGLLAGFLLGRYRHPGWPQPQGAVHWGCVVDVTQTGNGDWLFTQEFSENGNRITYRLLPDSQMFGIPLEKLVQGELVKVTLQSYGQALDGGLICTYLEVEPPNGGKREAP